MFKKLCTFVAIILCTGALTTSALPSGIVLAQEFTASENLGETLTLGQLSIDIPIGSHWYDSVFTELGGAMGYYRFSNYSSGGCVRIQYDTTMNSLLESDIKSFQRDLDIYESDEYLLASSETRQIDEVDVTIDYYSRGSFEKAVCVATITTDAAIYMIGYQYTDDFSFDQLLATITIDEVPPATPSTEPASADEPTENLGDTLTLGQLSIDIPVVSGWYESSSTELGGTMGYRKFYDLYFGGCVRIQYDTTMNSLLDSDIRSLQRDLDVYNSDEYVYLSSETREIDGIDCEIDYYSRGSFEKAVCIATITTDTAVYMIGYQYTDDFSFDQLLATITIDEDLPVVSITEPASDEEATENLGETLTLGQLSINIPTTSGWYNYSDTELGGAMGYYSYSKTSTGGQVRVLFDTTMNALDSSDIRSFQRNLDIYNSDEYVYESSETRQISGVACEIDYYSHGSFEKAVCVATITTDTAVYMIGYQYTDDFSFDQLLVTIAL